MGKVRIGPKHLLSKQKDHVSAPIQSFSIPVVIGKVTQGKPLPIDPVYIEKLVEVEKEVIKYVDKIVEVIKEVPVYVDREVVTYVNKEIKVIEEKIIEVEKEVIKYVDKEIEVLKHVHSEVLTKFIPKWVYGVIGLQSLVIVLLIAFK